MSLRVSAGLLKTRGGVGYLKAMFSAKVLIEGLGLAGHVTILGWFEFTFYSVESWEELMQFGVKIALNCIVLGHLLVLELIINLNLANSKEMFILTLWIWHRPAAQFQLLAVCSSWTRGHRANEPCLSRLQLANCTNAKQILRTTLEILTEMIKPSPRNFFLNPMQFSMFTLSN